MRYDVIFNEESTKGLNHLSPEGAEALCGRTGMVGMGGVIEYNEGKWTLIEEGFQSIYAYNHNISLSLSMVLSQYCKKCVKKAMMNYLDQLTNNE